MSLPFVTCPQLMGSSGNLATMTEDSHYYSPTQLEMPCSTHHRMASRLPVNRSI